MKSKTNKLTAFVLLCLILAANIVAAPSGITKLQTPDNSLIIDVTHFLDANSLQMFLTNIGNFAYDKSATLGRNDGLYYPRGTLKHCIYDAGIWVGAKVNGQIRLAIAEYSSEYTPGPMAFGTYQFDRGDFRVFKIRRGDDELNPDYTSWPIAMGAPVGASGKPLVLGDQTTWSVYNDADPLKHTNDAGRTEQLGIEIQQTSFAYARQGALGNTIFLKFKLINKGFTNLDSTYISIWVDPDLGDHNDDLVGCDTANSLGYCYQTGSDNLYGSLPPAVGVAFLQGPMVVGAADDLALMSGAWRKGFKNLPMTSFNIYTNGIDPSTPQETYSYMKGLNRDGSAVINPITNQSTSFSCPGDPIASTGWIDTTKSDKRMMLNSGPFTMLVGDTQEVVVAVLVGQGDTPLSSVTALKTTNEVARLTYKDKLQNCGDLDGSAEVSLSDVLILIKYLFGIGPTPVLAGTPDLNCDSRVNLTDAIILVNYIFLGGPSPCATCQK